MIKINKSAGRRSVSHLLNIISFISCNLAGLLLLTKSERGSLLDGHRREDRKERRGREDGWSVKGEGAEVRVRSVSVSCPLCCPLEGANEELRGSRSLSKWRIFFFSHLIPESPLHLSTYPSLPSVFIPRSPQEPLLFVHAPERLQHPALYLQSVWDEVFVCQPHACECGFMICDFVGVSISCLARATQNAKPSRVHVQSNVNHVALFTKRFPVCESVARLGDWSINRIIFVSPCGGRTRGKSRGRAKLFFS